MSRYDPDNSSDMSSSRGSLRKTDSMMGSGASLVSVGNTTGGVTGSVASSESPDSSEGQGMDSQVLAQQLREAKEERDRTSSKYDQVLVEVYGLSMPQ